MKNEMFENLTAFNQGIFNNAKQLYEINARAGEKLTENQMQFTSMYIENSIKQMELARDFKDPKAYMVSQSEMAKQCADKAVSINKEAVVIAADVRNELKTWFETGLQQATSAVEEGVSASKKAAA